LTDFEQAKIEAVKQKFRITQSRLRLFHLGQSIWRKVQSKGLTVKYGEDIEYSSKFDFSCYFAPAINRPNVYNYYCLRHFEEQDLTTIAIRTLACTKNAAAPRNNTFQIGNHRPRHGQ